MRAPANIPSRCRESCPDSCRTGIIEAILLHLPRKPRMSGFLPPSLHAFLGRDITARRQIARQGSVTRRSFSPNRRPDLEPLEPRELLTVNMSPQEQLMLELVNRARADPLAEVARNPFVDELNQDVDPGEEISPDPKQPLAPHQSLVDAMAGHTVDMLLRDYFGHDSPDGGTPSSRAREAGYPVGAGENIAWFGHTETINRNEEVYLRHEGLFESVGHRVNMMRENWREIGPAVRYGEFTRELVDYNSIMVGTMFGNRGGQNFITGVAITDFVVRNSFYDIGEGIGDLTITATHAGTGETYTDITGASGGYGIQVPKGTYTVTATGDRLPSPITVRAIQVDGENVKVDFNLSGMSTRYLDGVVFDDTNGNGSRGSNEVGVQGRTVWVDLNEDGIHDANEPSTVTAANGSYRIDGLPQGEYIIRQVVPERTIETLPPPGNAYVVPLGEQNLIGIDFGTQTMNDAPLAMDDQAETIAGESVRIDVAANDTDPEGRLATATIRVQTPPSHGSLTITGNSQFAYTPDADFYGTDSFTYTIADSAGLRSNPATVSIEVTGAFPWQNPTNAMDVNQDGLVLAQDVLIVIRELNRGGARLLEPRNGDEYFFDVSGDNYLSAIDALRIIIHLNREAASGSSSASGEPEPSVNLDAPADETTRATAHDAALAIVYGDDQNDDAGERV